MPGEYPVLDQVKVDILPFKELWDLQVEFNQKFAEWEKGHLKNLVPDEVEALYAKYRTQSMKLANTFESKRN